MHPFPACQTEGCCVGDCPSCAEIVRLRAELAALAPAERVCRAILAEHAALDNEADNSHVAYHEAWQEVDRAWAAYRASGGSEARSQSQPASVSATPLPSRPAAPACEPCTRAGLPPHDSGDLPAALGPRPCGWPDTWFESLGARP